MMQQIAEFISVLVTPGEKHPLPRGVLRVYKGERCSRSGGRNGALA
jgi:hypothetical protein